MHVTSTFLLILALSLVAGAALIAFLRRKNQEVVELKKEALEASAFLQKIGLPHSAAFWSALALEDFPTAWKELHTIIGIFKSPELRAATVAMVVDQYISDILKEQDTDEVKRLQQLLSGDWATAAKAPVPSGAALGTLSHILNPSVPGFTVHHTPAPFSVQPPTIATQIASAVVPAAAPIINQVTGG